MKKALISISTILVLWLLYEIILIPEVKEAEIRYEKTLKEEELKKINCEEKGGIMVYVRDLNSNVIDLKAQICIDKEIVLDKY